MYRRSDGVLEVLLVHPVGPFWAWRDEGAWSFPKREYDSDVESALDAAKREFAEETGFVRGTRHLSLGEARQRSGKLVSAWSFEGDCDPEARSNPAASSSNGRRDRASSGRARKQTGLPGGSRRLQHAITSFPGWSFSSTAWKRSACKPDGRCHRHESGDRTAPDQQGHGLALADRFKRSVQIADAGDADIVDGQDHVAEAKTCPLGGSRGGSHIESRLEQPARLLGCALDQVEPKARFAPVPGGDALRKIGCALRNGELHR
jgi:hypothetical protein